MPQLSVAWSLNSNLTHKPDQMPISRCCQTLSSKQISEVMQGVCACLRACVRACLRACVCVWAVSPNRRDQFCYKMLPSFYFQFLNFVSVVVCNGTGCTEQRRVFQLIRVARTAPLLSQKTTLAWSLSCHHKHARTQAHRVNCRGKILHTIIISYFRIRTVMLIYMGHSSENWSKL